MARTTEDPIVAGQLDRQAKKPRNLALQLGFIGVAAVAVYGFVQAAKSDQLRSLCSATCAMQPNYAGRNRLAPEFELKDTDGKVVRLTDFKGKTVVMNFWSYTCEPCIKEMPALARLAVALEGNDDVVFLTVNNDEAEEEQNLKDRLKTALATDPNLDPKVSKVLKEGRFPFRILRDPTSSVTKGMFGTSMVPETWIIDGAGYIRARFDGVREWDGGSARQAIDSYGRGPGCLVDFAQGKATGPYARLCDPHGG